MTDQMDLFDKPFHAITVFEMPHPLHKGRSLVVRYDNLDAMNADIARQLDYDQRWREQDVKAETHSRIAYIYACMLETSPRRVICLETYYPVL